MPATFPIDRLAPLALSACLVLGLGSAVVAQEPSPESQPPRPDGSWVVAGYDATGNGLVAPRPDAAVRVDFLADGRLEADAGCGELFGGYFAEDDLLRMDFINQGLDPCGQRRRQAALDLAIAAESVRSWQPAADSLELFDESGILRLVLEPVAVSTPLGAWTVDRLARNNGRLAAGPADPPATLDLRDDGSVSGSTGCRLYDGSYTVDAGRITILVEQLTGLPCEGESRRLERRLIRALEGAAEWQAAPEFVLLDVQGQVLATFLAGEPPPEPASPAPSSAPAISPSPSIDA